MWIILQPSSGICDHLNQILEQDMTDPQAPEVRIAQVHLAFVSLMANNWQEYLEYLQSEMVIFVRIQAH